MRKIIADAVVDNGASISILKELAFEIEGTFRQEFAVEGEYRDGVRLGLLREEFDRHISFKASNSAKDNG